MQEFYQELCNNIDKRYILTEEPMSKHTTFRVGGGAEYYIKIQNEEMLQSACIICKKHKVNYFVLGNGSNLLVGDKGIRGVVLEIGNGMNNIQIQGNTLVAQAGALLSRIGKRALDAKLAGFEFAAGIPGTIGGAAVMNAGAYGGEMKDIVTQVKVLNKDGEIQVLEAKELDFGYRHSAILEKEAIVLEVTVELEAGEAEAIKTRMDELKVQRITKQPLEYGSAGSTFKRPEGYFAGKLIQDAGLRGFQVGGAQVSEKHCGFVINKKNATANDIAELMKQVSQKVEEEFGVKLEPEVKRVGEF